MHLNILISLSNRVIYKSIVFKVSKPIFLYACSLTYFRVGCGLGKLIYEITRIDRILVILRDILRWKLKKFTYFYL